ncbi:hypothetical protein JW979_04565 [bacterium]|nr:hypothetical protein [candidate division CSSED10-310 bacterium]
MNFAAGFSTGLACGLGSGISIGISSGKQKGREEILKNIRDYAQTEGMTLATSTGDVIPVESFIEAIDNLEEEIHPKTRLFLAVSLGLVVAVLLVGSFIL